MAILFMAFMVLTSLKYNSYTSHKKEVAKKQEAVQKASEAKVLEDLPGPGAAEILSAS